MVDQAEIHKKALSDNREEQVDAVHQLRDCFAAFTDGSQTWKDLSQLTVDVVRIVRREVTGAIEAAFTQIPDKESVSQDLNRLTDDEDSEVREGASEAIGADFSKVPDKELVWQDIHKLTGDENWIVRRKAAEVIGNVFYQVPDKDAVWQDLHKLTGDEDKYVRWKAVEALGSVFSLVPDKDVAWQDLHKLTGDEDIHVRRKAVEVLGSIFSLVPDKDVAWQDLHKLTGDEDTYVRRIAARALDAAFFQVSYKDAAWQDMHRMTSNKDSYVRRKAVEALGFSFFQVPNRDAAWQDLHRLTGDEDSDVRWETAKALASAFFLVPDKNAAWKDVHRLTSDKDSYVRRKVAEVIGAIFFHIPDKDAAWQDLIQLNGNEDRYVRVSANHSLGKISVFKATEAEDEEDFRRELENALEFFEKSATETKFTNPAKFCLPFYRSFYALTFKKEDTEAEVQKYLSEAKSASEGSKSKEELLEAIKNLSNALKEAETARDLGTMKCDLDAYKRYCDQAGELLNDTEEKAPRATKLIRTRLVPVIDRRIRDLLEEIRDESDTVCKTAGRKEAKIGCEVRKHTNAALATDNPVEVDRELNYVLRKFYIWCDSILDENERSYIKDTIADAKNEGLLGKARNIRILVGELMKDSGKYVITGSSGIQIIEGNGNVQNMISPLESLPDPSQEAETSKKQEVSKIDRIPYLSVLEIEIFRLFSSIYQKLREEGASEVNSKTLELLKYKLFDLTTSDGNIRWLDVGCGDGRSLEILDAVHKRKQIKYHGIDGAYKHLDKAEERALVYGLIDTKFEKMDAAAMSFDSEYDIISAVLLFHEVDPFRLPFLLKNMLKSLKKDGIIVISDFQEPYEREIHVVVWTAEDIRHLLGRICKVARENIETIPASKYPEDLGFYRGYVRKSEIDEAAFKEFMLRYDEFLIAKKEASKQKREALRGQIRGRVCEILGRSDVDSKNISKEEMERIRDEIEEVYGIKAYKIDLFTSQIEFLDDKIEEFKKGAR